MSDGYYDPHPLLSLDQPLVLIGHPGAGVDQIGRAIAGRTGLTFNDVERAVEATAGGSRSRILIENGLERLRALEAAELDKAIRRKPFGVVVAESSMLEDGGRRRWLRESCALVYVRRPEDRLLARIQQQVARAPGSLPDFMVGAPRRVEELRTHLASREAALGEIDVVVEAGDDHAHVVAAQILASLGDLLGVEPIETGR